MEEIIYRKLKARDREANRGATWTILQSGVAMRMSRKRFPGEELPLDEAKSAFEWKV
jgi:hypothetical protein